MIHFNPTELGLHPFNYSGKRVHKDQQHNIQGQLSSDVSSLHVRHVQHWQPLALAEGCKLQCKVSVALEAYMPTSRAHCSMSIAL